MRRISKIDVLIVTYNSARTLDKCLRSIKTTIPYNRILVGDGGSKDGTIEIAERHGAEVYLFTGRDNMIGRIRYKLAELAETSWLLYVDSDMYLLPNWWDHMKKFIHPRVGMAMASDVYTNAQIYQRYHDWRNERFGFVTFGNTLCPRRLILEFREMNKLHVAEDSAYAKFCRKKGYLVIPVLKNLVVHDKSLEGMVKAYRRWGADMRSRKEILSFFLRAQIHLRNVVWFTLEKRARGNELLFLLKMYTEMYRGFLNTTT